MIYLFLVVTVLSVIGYRYLTSSSTKKEIEFIEVPEHWDQVLSENVLFYKKLNSIDRLSFKERIQVFLNSVKIEAIEFELEELDSLLVASSAIIPVFYFENWMYSNIKTVIIYPDYFNKALEFHDKAKNKNIGGLVGNGAFEDTMILSRKALHYGFSNKSDKGNTGIHEFVHLLDKLDGKIDGIPEVLMDNENVLIWLNLIHEKMEAINKDKSDIRNYGGTSKEEFFAVASEYFFERSSLLKRKHPELHKMLTKCFVPNSVD